jgi:hypothetical protein
MGEVGRHRQSQQPRQMRQKIMYQNGRTLEFVGSSSHGAAGARVHGLPGEQLTRVGLIRLFVCVFFFFFFSSFVLFAFSPFLLWSR